MTAERIEKLQDQIEAFITGLRSLAALDLPNTDTLALTNAAANMLQALAALESARLLLAIEAHLSDLAKPRSAAVPASAVGTNVASRFGPPVKGFQE